MTEKDAILAALVKPLGEWKRFPDFPREGVGCWTSTGYGVVPDDDLDADDVEFELHHQKKSHGYYPTLAAAQAAAEADYRARIAAALNMDAVAELVEAAIEVADDGCTCAMCNRLKSAISRFRVQS